jgi:hypothetical protein
LLEEAKLRTELNAERAVQGLPPPQAAPKAEEAKAP